MMKTAAVVACVLSLSPAAWSQGGGRGRGGQAQGGRGDGPNFPQQTRQLAAPEVIARGKALYGVNCTACHGADLRGGDQGGPSLLRSLVALSDQHGETIAPILKGSRQQLGMPAFTFPDADITAIAEYIHSELARVGRQGRPPESAGPSMLNVLVGGAAAGQTYFATKCTGCHSINGDLKGIASKYPDSRELQNAWVFGGGGGGGGGGRGRGPGGKPQPVAVTFADGQRVEGTLIRKDDFIVTLTLADGTRRSITRDGDNPKVEVTDPDRAHKALVPTLTDDDMHNVTAYLATIH